jgi:hypothetical protein
LLRHLQAGAKQSKLCSISCSISAYERIIESWHGNLLLQYANGLPSASVAPGQTIMLPCGRLLSYINAYNVGLLTKATAATAAG